MAGMSGDDDHGLSPSAARLLGEATARLAADPERSDDIGRIDAALGRIRRSMARQSLGRRVLADLGVAVESGLIEALHSIERGAGEDPAGVAIGTVAASLGIDPSQASRLVADAVRRGYVERVPSPTDGRRSVLRLSGAGEALLAAFQTHKRSLLHGHFEDWSREDLADFARLLGRFSAIVRPDDGA